MPLPFAGPFNLRPSVARSGDYLFLASNDALIDASLAVKAGTQLGIKSTDEFKKLSQRIPEQGNSFTFRSSKVADMIAQLQPDIPGVNPATNNFGQAQVLTNLFGARGTAGSYRVSANTDEGWLFTGNSGQNPATTFLLLPTMAVTGMIATVAIPGLVRSRQAANETAAVANLRTVAAAETMYSSSSHGNYADLRALIAAGLVDSRFNLPVSGYQISITASGRTYTATAIPTAPNSGRYGYFITTEGVVRYSKETPLAPSGLSGKPVQ
jgi:type II secretory pathway pseudopilin PulG